MEIRFRALSGTGRAGVASDTVVLYIDRTVPEILLHGDTESYLPRDTVQVSVAVGCSGLKSLEVSRDGNAYTDITDRYADGYTVTILSGLLPMPASRPVPQLHIPTSVRMRPLLRSTAMWRVLGRGRKLP